MMDSALLWCEMFQSGPSSRRKVKLCKGHGEAETKGKVGIQRKGRPRRRFFPCSGARTVGNGWVLDMNARVLGIATAVVNGDALVHSDDIFAHGTHTWSRLFSKRLCTGLLKKDRAKEQCGVPPSTCIYTASRRDGHKWLRRDPLVCLQSRCCTQTRFPSHLLCPFSSRVGA